uniref:Chlorophyll(Ide) b reductase n=1 Tax=Eutreptiella gymnastica TaxID=73025 RepID=A0A7S4GHP5_9EUGL
MFAFVITSNAIAFAQPNEGPVGSRYATHLITSAPQSVGAVTRSAPLGLTRGPAPRFSPDYARPSPHRATDSEARAVRMASAGDAVGAGAGTVVQGSFAAGISIALLLAFAGQYSVAGRRLVKRFLGAPSGAEDASAALLPGPVWMSEATPGPDAGRRALALRAQANAEVDAVGDDGPDFGAIAPPLPPQPDEPGGTASAISVVITGASKGIGAALAAAFLARGDNVCIAARSEDTLGSATDQLAPYAAGGAKVTSVPCDVADPAAVDRMMAHATEQFGRVDVVICNAGSNAYTYAPIAETEPTALEEILLTNGVGTLLCCRAAIRTMQAQPQGGHVFVMEGAGSDGNPTQKYAAYGFSKAGMGQLAKSLSAECKDAQQNGASPVGVHTLSPGLVFTELVAAGNDSFGQTGRFFVNTIGAIPVEVAADVVPQMRALVAQGSFAVLRAPVAVRFLTPDKLVKKLYARVIKNENKDRFQPEDTGPSAADRKIRLQWTPWLEEPAEKLLAAFKNEE